MDDNIVSRGVEIHAPAHKVWNIFTDPFFTQLIGGEFVTDWQAGSPFRFVGWNGEVYADGTLLKCAPGKILQYSIFEKSIIPKKVNAVRSRVTYQLEEYFGRTTLIVSEEFVTGINDHDHARAHEMWDLTLLHIRDITEN